MKGTLNFSLGLVCSLAAGALGQSGPPPATSSESPQYSVQGGPATAGVSAQSGEPVSYASVSQLNGLLAQLEAASKKTQEDLVRMRVERWKTDNRTKKEALANVDSIQRNLQGALPEVVSELRNAPESLPSTFKLYRNLDALYDVMGNVVELAGAFGSKEDVQTLSNDLSGFEGTRKQLADRLASLSEAKEAQIVRLRTDLKTAQAAIPVTPPQKVLVDDTTPAPKPPVVKKKPATKPKTTTPSTTKPASGQTQAAPAQQTPPKSQ